MAVLVNSFEANGEGPATWNYSGHGIDDAPILRHQAGAGVILTYGEYSIRRSKIGRITATHLGEPVAIATPDGWAHHLNGDSWAVEINDEGVTAYRARL